MTATALINAFLSHWSPLTAAVMAVIGLLASIEKLQQIPHALWLLELVKAVWPNLPRIAELLLKGFEALPKPAAAPQAAPPLPKSGPAPLLALFAAFALVLPTSGCALLGKPASPAAVDAQPQNGPALRAVLIAAGTAVNIAHSLHQSSYRNAAAAVRQTLPAGKPAAEVLADYDAKMVKVDQLFDARSLALMNAANLLYQLAQGIDTKQLGLANLGAMTLSALKTATAALSQGAVGLPPIAIPTPVTAAINALEKALALGQLLGA